MDDDTITAILYGLAAIALVVLVAIACGLAGPV